MIRQSVKPATSEPSIADRYFGWISSLIKPAKETVSIYAAVSKTQSGRVKADAEAITQRVGGRYENLLTRLVTLIGTVLTSYQNAVTGGLGTVWRELRKFPKWAARRTKRAGKAAWNWLTSPIRRGREGLAHIRSAFRGARGQGAGALTKAVLCSLGIVGRGLWATTATLFNHLAPIGAAAVLIYTLNYVGSLNLALAVTYEGEFLGYISDEATFDEAERLMQQRIVYEEGQDALVCIPQYTLQVVSADALTDVDTICDQLIMASVSEIEEAKGLYIDGQFMGAVKSASNLNWTLNSMLLAYRTEYPDAEVTFVRDVVVKDGLYPTSTLKSENELVSMVSQEVEGEQTYVAQPGDSVSLIADKVGVKSAVLMNLNPGIEKRLMVGDVVLTSSSVPFMEVQITRKETTTETIMYEVIRNQTSSQNSGYTKVTQAGVTGEKQVTADVTYVNGIQVSRVVVDEVITKEPVAQKITIGTAMQAAFLAGTGGSTSKGTGIGTGTFIWPTDAGYISCAYWGYYGHTGMDIASKAGTGIRAADDGVVITVKSLSSGYGKYIIIDHGNGYQTLYAHCSQLYVSYGQVVRQGELIAAMGRTGNATGNHLHFEVRVYGSAKNPAKYIGTRYV